MYVSACMCNVSTQCSGSFFATDGDCVCVLWCGDGVGCVGACVCVCTCVHVWCMVVCLCAWHASVSRRAFHAWQLSSTYIAACGLHNNSGAVHPCNAHILVLFVPVVAIELLYIALNVHTQLIYKRPSYCIIRH